MWKKTHCWIVFLFCYQWKSCFWNKFIDSRNKTKYFNEMYSTYISWSVFFSHIVMAPCFVTVFWYGIFWKIGASIMQLYFLHWYFIVEHLYLAVHTRVYSKVSGLATWSKNCKWYSSLPLVTVVSLFFKSV
jgi:hypothetical protein